MLGLILAEMGSGESGKWALWRERGPLGLVFGVGRVLRGHLLGAASVIPGAAQPGPCGFASGCGCPLQ